MSFRGKLHFGRGVVHIRGRPATDILVEKGKVGTEVIPMGLPSEALKRLESLRPKPILSTPKRPNIKFSL